MSFGPGARASGLKVNFRTPSNPNLRERVRSKDYEVRQDYSSDWSVFGSVSNVIRWLWTAVWIAASFYAVPWLLNTYGPWLRDHVSLAPITLGRGLNLLGLVLGGAGAYVLFRYSYTMQGLAVWADAELVASVTKANQRRASWQRIGLALVMASFIVQGVAQAFE